MSDKNTNLTKEKWELFKWESFDSVSGISASRSKPSEFSSVFSSKNWRKEEFQITTFGNSVKNGLSSGGTVETAKERAAAIESDAYEKGFSQGEKDGLEMGTKKNEKIVKNISNILRDITNAKRDVIKKYEEEILRLIDLIARKVVEAHVSIDSGAVRETILKALKLAVDRGALTMRINPDDFDYVKEIKPEFFEKVDGLQSITIVSDASISHGGCYIETHFGDIDARLEKQLDKIYESIRKTFEKGLSGTPNR